jgi:hypothetical protein
VHSYSARRRCVVCSSSLVAPGKTIIFPYFKDTCLVVINILVLNDSDGYDRVVINDSHDRFVVVICGCCSMFLGCEFS